MTIDDAPSLVPADIAGCQHQRDELRRRRIANGAVQFRFQCLSCGRSKGPAVKKLAALEHYRPYGFEEDDIPWWDEALFERGEQAIQRYFQNRHEHFEQKRQQEKTEWRQRYKAYLLTDDWRRMREVVLSRAGGLCEGCRQRRATQVHHLTYDHVGHEFLWELVAICNYCHDRVHAPHPDWLANYVSDDEVN